MSSLSEDVAAIRELQEQLKDIKFGDPRRRELARMETNAYHRRCLDETTGDRITDLVIEVVGRPDAAAEATVRQMEARLASSVGQLALVVHEIDDPGDRNGTGFTLFTVAEGSLSATLMANSGYARGFLIKAAEGKMAGAHGDHHVFTCDDQPGFIFSAEDLDEWLHPERPTVMGIPYTPSRLREIVIGDEAVASWFQTHEFADKRKLPGVLYVMYLKLGKDARKIPGFKERADKILWLLRNLYDWVHQRNILRLDVELDRRGGAATELKELVGKIRVALDSAHALGMDCHPAVARLRSEYLENFTLPEFFEPVADSLESVYEEVMLRPPS